MNSQQPPITDPEKMAEEITAYLDGELSPERLREVEQRLADDDTYRAKLHEYERSWQLLDELPREEVGQQFAATTVELVAVSAQDENGDDNWGRQLLRQWSLGGFSVLAACITGFLVTSGVAALLSSTGLVEDANERLLIDLPVIEKFDQLQLIDNVSFLRDYSQLPAVADALQAQQRAADGADLAPPHNESLDQRRRRVEQLSDTGKRRLAVNQKQFDQLAPAAQQQLRELYGQLADDPQAADLSSALDHYYDWYRQLTATQHVELRLSAGEKRIAYILQLLEDQKHESRGRRGFPDRQGRGPDGTVGRLPRPGGRPEAIDAATDRVDEVSRERLMAFFRSLPSDQQQRLKPLPPEEFMQRLKLLFARRQDRPGGGRPPRERFGEGRLDGPPHRPPGGPPLRHDFRDGKRGDDFESDRRRPPYRRRPDAGPAEDERPAPPPPTR